MSRSGQLPPFEQRWVHKLGKAWIFNLAGASGLGIVIGGIVSIVGALARWHGVLYTGFAISGASLAAHFIFIFLFYRSLICPRCGHNPTRRKNGRKKVKQRATQTYVLRLLDCPKCGEY